jgi:transcriptional regulator with XRE-family HTH domain
MENIKQTEIAKRAKVSDAFISLILNGKKRPSWPTAKRLAEATGTNPVLWLEGTAAEMKAVLKYKTV